MLPHLSKALFTGLALLALALLAQAAETAPETAPEKPWIFAHRGASGERPEHTLGAYKLALEEGADYIEPDLRMTRDGVLIALHDGSLNRTTDVAAHPEFADRAKLDAKGGKYWVPADFTLAEIRTLRCRQGTAGRPKDFDGKEGIPTLAEILELLRAWNRDHQARAGMVPELRGGAEAFVAFVRENRLEDAGAPPVYLQSFEAGTLKKVRQQLRFPAAILLGQAPKPGELGELKKNFDAVAVAKAACLGPESAAWIAEAHAKGLQVIAWTFEDAAYDKSRFKSGQEEMLCALRNGVDAVFTDFPASGAKAKKAFLGGR